MPSIITRPGTREKLAILSTDCQYDLACACGTNEQDRRHRSGEDKWIYPVTLQNGGHGVLFKTLISNVCANDCRYCPLRAEEDPRRCTLEPEETVRAFMDYHRAGKVFGLFLSSGVIGTPDRTMERLVAIARLLRQKEEFRGYIHLKVIPGASDAAVQEAVSLASAVSLNIETPGEAHCRRLSAKKDYMQDIIRPIKLISELARKGPRRRRVRQSTQFVVGASDETDREIVRYMAGLYTRLGLDRVYFSAYQRGLGHADLPGERAAATNRDVLTREHRLYQVDWLIRKYGFEAGEIPFDAANRLSLAVDPKEHWAQLHPEKFPVDVNRADRLELLRVPGFGPTTVQRILERRANGGRVRALSEVGRAGRRLSKAAAYVKF
ncbi:MAG: radical SAM protein [Kiritimatiellae bacterium]|nr:radical SAM protein [Kiritimatiellia bacterium]